MGQVAWRLKRDPSCDYALSVAQVGVQVHLRADFAWLRDRARTSASSGPAVICEARRDGDVGRPPRGSRAVTTVMDRALATWPGRSG